MMKEIPEAKVCSRCNRLKSLYDFYKCKDAKDGLQPWCKDCQKEYDRNKRISKSNQQKQINKDNRVAELKRLSQYHLNYGLDYEFIGKKTRNKIRNKIVYKCLTCGKIVKSDLQTAWSYRFNCEDCAKNIPGLPTEEIRKPSNFTPKVIQLKSTKYNKQCVCDNDSCNTCESHNNETSIALKSPKQKSLEEYIKVIIVPVPQYIEKPQPKNKLTIFEKIKKIFHK